MAWNPHKLKDRHFNLWVTMMIAAFVHMWIAWAFLDPAPAKDLTANSILFTYVKPSLWAALSAVTGLGILGGIYLWPFRVAQLSSVFGAILASALTINGLVLVVHNATVGIPSPIAVRLVFGLGLFYLAGHFAFSTEPPENPKS